MYTLSQYPCNGQQILRLPRTRELGQPRSAKKDQPGSNPFTETEIGWAQTSTL